MTTMRHIESDQQPDVRLVLDAELINGLSLAAIGPKAITLYPELGAALDALPPNLDEREVMALHGAIRMSVALQLGLHEKYSMRLAHKAADGSLMSIGGRALDDGDQETVNSITRVLASRGYESKLKKMALRVLEFI